ncbi:MAG: GAF domain-containing protein [Flavobacteriia bacterium]|nr:GAF domain-containing protein [Flavobacteriia bacterium]
MSFVALSSRIDDILSQSGKEGLKEICELLHNEVKYYNWVGFYFMNHETRMLHIGPYAGAETDHVEIPFGKGICGQVAESGDSFIVDDVTAQDNYIACSIETKAEIVVPMYKGETLIGQIDIDSHDPAPFGDEDEAFLKEVCEKVSAFL